MKTIKRLTDSSFKHFHAMLKESHIDVFVPAYGHDVTFDKTDIFNGFQILASDSFDAYIESYNCLNAELKLQESERRHIELGIAVGDTITPRDLDAFASASEAVGEWRNDCERIKQHIIEKTGACAWYNAEALYSAITGVEDMEWM